MVRLLAAVVVPSQLTALTEIVAVPLKLPLQLTVPVVPVPLIVPALVGLIVH